MLLPYACIICRQLQWSNAGLCTYCADRLYEWRQPVTRDKPICTMSLFSWWPNSPLALSWFIRALKGVEQPERWQQLAIWLIEVVRVDGNATLIPIPSRKNNHALGLCRSLSKITGLRVADELAIKSSQLQKKRKREERRQIRFARKTCNSFTNVVIVDDVVTTGATVGAAFEALGRPKYAQAWAILDRRPCGSEAPLL